MNRFLANAMAFLNGVAAIFLTFGVMFALWEDIGLVGGFVVGSGVAMIVCGFAALLIDIRNVLVELRDK